MEEPKLSYGSSILVPSVQELAKQALASPPPRYIKPHQDPPIVSNSTLIPTIPVIDMQKLLYGEDMDSELETLHSASKEWGFFQLVNHDVNTLLVEKVRHEIQEFFQLPLEEKKAYWQKEGEVEGFGQAFVVSNEQKLDWGDIFFMLTLPIYARKPHLFPQLPLPFRDTMDTYSLELKNLAMKIIGMMEKALKMEVNEMTNLFEDGTQSMRMNYYPPCPQPELVIGLTPHSDSVGLTILLQVNEMEGLQIRKEGMWIPIKPLPNAFIVNIGDILEMVTNGKYCSIEHQATVNSVKERLSIATFYSPRHNVEIGPAQSLVTPQTPALFKRIGMEGYLKGLFTRQLDGKSYLDVMRIENGKNNSN